MPTGGALVMCRNSIQFIDQTRRGSLSTNGFAPTSSTFEAAALGAMHHEVHVDSLDSISEHESACEVVDASQITFISSTVALLATTK